MFYDINSLYLVYIVISLFIHDKKTKDTDNNYNISQEIKRKQSFRFHTFITALDLLLPLGILIIIFTT